MESTDVVSDRVDLVPAVQVMRKYNSRKNHVKLGDRRVKTREYLVMETVGWRGGEGGRGWERQEVSGRQSTRRATY